MSDYRLLVIGTGPGGYAAALRSAALGWKTAVVERRDVGGTCLNRGCVPTKVLLHSAELYSAMRDCARFGLHAGDISYDIGKIIERKEEITGKLRAGMEQQLKANKVDLLRGSGKIIGSGRVEVTGEDTVREYSADRILIASGSVPSIPPIPGIGLPGVVTSDDLLGVPGKAYASLVIIGGGVIGVEFASVYAAFGCKVTIIEALDRILPGLDREISQSMSIILKKRGVSVFTGCRVTEIVQSREGLRVDYTCRDELRAADGEAVLAAIGRKPDTEGLLGEGMALETDRGRIVVDGKFATSLANVYAVGDVSSKIQLAHAATAQGEAAVDMMGGRNPSADYSVIPSCIYTSPEIASAGMTADDAKAAGRSVTTGKYVMYANAKTLIGDGERGFIRIVADKDTGRVLGAQMMCGRATDMISELATAIVNGLTAEQMMRTVRPHPTFSEGVSGALEALDSASGK